MYILNSRKIIFQTEIFGCNLKEIDTFSFILKTKNLVLEKVKMNSKNRVQAGSRPITFLLQK